MLAQQSRPFTNTASGNLNQRQTHLKNKLIDLEDLDVELLSPHFLQAKTLKKPLLEHQLQLSKTIPQGLNAYHPSRSLSHTPPSPPTTVTFQKEIPRPQAAKPQSLSRIDTSQLNIKPAYKKTECQRDLLEPKNSQETFLKDKNTILAAILKKGGKTEIAVQPKFEQPQEKKKVGPAQAKLKALMNKKDLVPTIEVTSAKEPKIKQIKVRLQADEIGEEIYEQIDQYGNEQFEKLSVGYESAIKESIAATESNVIKESIRESVRESISGSGGHIKESIREDIRQSLGGSSRSLKEDIVEQISGSKPKDESIEQVYQQIFEDVEVSNSLSKSQSRFKKSQNLKEDSLSQSASKSFRMKTNVVKSLKYAEELLKRQKEYVVPKSIETKMKGQVIKEKDNLKQIQQKLTKFMSKPSFGSQKVEKNKDLYFHFKVQLNRLISSQNFQTKLKKLVSFLSIGSDIAPSRKAVDELQENVLKNVMMQIEGIRTGQDHLNKIQNIKAQYEQKLKEELLVQEVKLRAEMNQKLSQKDFELKKMIAELQSRMMSRPYHGQYQAGESSLRAQQYEVDSDYSIDSSNVSWKADLWELLPEFQKKKLYDKQSAQVTQFLADIMVNELQEEALDRSMDISFEFPQEYNNIPINFQPIQKSKQPQRIDQSKSAQRKSSTDFLSDLPKLNIRKPSVSSEVSAEFEKEEEIKTEKICRDDRIKAEIIKILAEYKPLFLRKKGQVVRSIMRVLLSKEGQAQKYTLSSLLQIGILNERESKKEHKMYLRAYEEELIMSLVGVYNSSLNRRQPDIEEQMKKKYDRLLVVCQVAIAEKCSERVALDCERGMKYNVSRLTREAISEMERHPCPIDIPANENYMQLKCRRQEKQIKKEIVNQIVEILAAEFAAQFPKQRR